MVLNKHEENRTKRVRNILVAITGSNDTLIDCIINHTYYKLVLLEKEGQEGVITHLIFLEDFIYFPRYLTKKQ